MMNFLPHSRATDVNVSDVAAVPELEIMALTKEGSLAIAKTKDSRQFFVTCHAEYDANTLALEYNRDMEKVLQALIFQSTIFQMMIRQRHQLSPGALQDSSYILIG